APVWPRQSCSTSGNAPKVMILDFIARRTFCVGRVRLGCFSRRGPLHTRLEREQLRLNQSRVRWVLQPGLDAAGQGPKVGHALDLIVGKFYAEVMFQPGN